MINEILKIYLNDDTVKEGGDIIVKEYSSNELSFLKWENQPKAQPTKEQFDAIKEQLYPAYKEQRASEYPSMADQLDDIFHNGIDGWRTSIQAIKDKYPKGDS